VAIGAGIGNIQEIVDVGLLINAKVLVSTCDANVFGALTPCHCGGQKYRRVSPFFIPRVLINLAAGHVSIENGLKVGEEESISSGGTALTVACWLSIGAEPLVRDGLRDW
jgi:3-oxoacyl-[acyl-carrier-protein] synthase II